VYVPELAPGSAYNSTLASVPGKADHLFFTSGQFGGLGQANPEPSAVFKRSTDGGTTWTTVPNVLEVYSFGFGDEQQPANYPSIFIAGWVNGQWGIWLSNDNASSWTKIGDFPLERADVLSSVEGAKDGSGRVYVAFRGSGYVYGTPSAGIRPQPPKLLP
jgi:hypothetical protein